jgi:hypothetical protein
MPGYFLHGKQIVFVTGAKIIGKMSRNGVDKKDKNHYIIGGDFNE